MAGKTIAYLNVLLGADSGRLTKALDTSEKAVKRFGLKLQDIGADLSLKVTAPLTAIGYISTQTASRFEDAMLKVKALSGASSEEFNKLKQTAKELGATTRFSANEVGDAMGYMALAGFNTNQTLSATPSILSLAAASATDLASASDIVTDTMSAFKISAQESNKVSDIFALTQAKSNTSVLQLGEAFKYVAPNFASANQSIEDTSSLLSVLANSGFKGSIAGTALNAMLKDLIKNSKDGSIEVGNTAVAIYDSSGTMRSTIDIMEDFQNATKGMTQSQKDSALGAIFEERSIRAVNIILNSGTEELRRYQGLLNSATGSAEKMAVEMESGLGGSLRKMNSSLESIQIVIGENLAPAIGVLANVIQGTANFVNSLDSTTQKIIITFGAVTAVIPPLLFGLGKLTTMYISLVAKSKVLITTMGVSQTALTAFGATLYSVILPITATVGALYALYKVGEYFNKQSKLNKRVSDELNISSKVLNETKQTAIEKTKELGEKTKDFSKLSEKERKNIIATTEAKILDLEATVKQQKALAILTANKAKDLTLWEKFTTSIFSFGNIAVMVSNQAKKSMEKYTDALNKNNDVVIETENEILNLKTALDNLNNVNTDVVEGELNSLGEVGKKTKSIIQELEKELIKIGITKDVDNQFNNIDARVNTLKTALIDLRVNGVSPLSTTYQEIKKQYDQALDSKNVIELGKNLSDLSKRSFVIDLKIGGKNLQTNLVSPVINDSIIKYTEDANKKLFESNMKNANNIKKVNDKVLEDQRNFDEQFKQQWGGTVQSFTIDTVSSFAEAFGSLVVNGRNGIKEFSSNILGSFGKFLVQMGKMGLLYSKFALKMKTAFANPAVGIGASLALIAVGGAMSAFAGKINSTVGSGSGGSSGGGNTFNPTYLNSRGIGNSENNKIEFEIKGDKLVGVLENNSRFKRRFTNN